MVKKFLLIVAVFLIVPTNVFGKTYKVTNSGFEVFFDEQIWDVFALNKLINVELLEKYDSDNEDMQNYLNENSMYIYAIYNGEEIFEFAVRYSSEIVNDKRISYDQLGAAIAEQRGADNYEIYKNKYNYVKLEYYEPVYNMYLIEYHIIINSQYYLFTAQKEIQFSEDEKSAIKEVIDSVEFHENTKKAFKFQIDWMDIIEYGISSTVSISVIYFFLEKMKKYK